MHDYNLKRCWTNSSLIFNGCNMQHRFQLSFDRGDMSCGLKHYCFIEKLYHVLQFFAL